MQPMTQEFITSAKARADAPIVALFKQEVPRLLAAQEEAVALLRAQYPDLPQNFFAPLRFQGSAEEFAQGWFMQRIGKLYKHEDRDFIFDRADKFERVRWGMAYFSLLKPDTRVFEALRLEEIQLRTGWQRLGIPIEFNQTVADHHRCGTALAVMLFPEKPDVARCFRYNDIGKMVIGDFTPHDDISRPDKARLEALGLRLLTTTAETRGNPLAADFRRAVEIYDGATLEHAVLRRMMKDCDLLEMTLESLYIMDCCPSDKKASIIDGLQEFWAYVDKGLTHRRSRLLFDGLSTARYGLEFPAQEVWSRAALAVVAGEPDQRLYGEMIAARAKEWGDYLSPRRPPAPAADFQPRPAT